MTTNRMHYVLAQDITVPVNRDRKIFSEESIYDLAKSIERVGLIHLPVIRQDGLNFILVVGERRLRAMNLLHSEKRTFMCMGRFVDYKFIPVLFYDELDELRAKEVELEENLKRIDLSWKEKIEAIATLHNMQGGNFADTSRVLREQYNRQVDNGTQVKTAVLLSQHMHHPEVAAARNETDAIKAMYKVIELGLNAKLGLIAKHSVNFIRGDAIEEMAKLPDETFDCICTDPPYGIDADKSGLHKFGAQVHKYKDSWTETYYLLCKFAGETKRVSKKQAHMYLFCDFSHFWEIACILQDAQWEAWPRPIIWAKDSGFLPVPDYGPRRMYECVLFANKGKKMVTGVYSDVITIPHDKTKLHAAQKPVALIENLLSRSTRPGDVVLDPFCGSGTIFCAAANLKLNATGIDSDPVMAKIIEERIK